MHYLPWKLVKWFKSLNAFTDNTPDNTWTDTWIYNGNVIPSYNIKMTPHDKINLDQNHRLHPCTSIKLRGIFHELRTHVCPAQHIFR